MPSHIEWAMRQVTEGCFRLPASKKLRLLSLAACEEMKAANIYMHLEAGPSLGKTQMKAQSWPAP